MHKFTHTAYKSTMLALCVGMVSLLVACGRDTEKTPKSEASKSGDVYRFTVLHTNDHHGHFPPNRRGEGGLAAQKTLIDDIKAQAQAEGNFVLVLSAGDVATGLPESDLLNAQPDFELMRDLGYDAMVLGNHEFDKSPEVLEQQEAWANFPFISANVVRTKESQQSEAHEEGKTSKKRGRTLVAPYIIEEQNGLRVAVFGLTTEDTTQMVSPENVAHLEFKDPKAVAKRMSKQLRRREGADVVIALTHMGYYEDANHGSNAPGDVSLARAMPEGALDLIIGGHSHTVVCMLAENTLRMNHHEGDACQPDQQNGTWIFQAGDKGRFMGRADFAYQNGELTLENYEMIPINLTQAQEIDGKREYVLIQDSIRPDPAIADRIQAYQAISEERLDAKVAFIDGKLEGDRAVVRNSQTNLGMLIVAAHIDRVGADFGIMNSGGIRASIPQGDVSYRQIITTQPFGNFVSYVDLTGQEVMDYLDVVLRKTPGSGAYPQVARLAYTMENDTLGNVRIAGEPIDMAKTYRVSLNSFSAEGGDGYPVLVDHPNYVNTGFVDADVLRGFMEAHTPVYLEEYSVTTK